MIFTATTTPAARRSVYAPALRSLDRFLDDALTAARQGTTQFKDEGAHWSLAIDVPGVSREQLSIAIEGQNVTVETVEGAPRQYKKRYELAQDIDAAASQAKLENGVLTLTLTKLQPASKATTLQIG
ncbi:Hsp20/alpha crystallin family protein [Ottowia testudinis]|uniref:Hsp20/alpha crystallin family protein n=1 Tax=Ottowia testudinis TaxID=2816950 RepID=A0A975H4E3_9BURK|nr:Hsp20/alpha crystallin family protein [Ottowia testudinis]QTD46774.1 Hsp20/alpha crystallin family protein [Ottowia testudinis]